MAALPLAPGGGKLEEERTWEQRQLGSWVEKSGWWSAIRLLWVDLVAAEHPGVPSRVSAVALLPLNT